MGYTVRRRTEALDRSEGRLCDASDGGKVDCPGVLLGDGEDYDLTELASGGVYTGVTHGTLQGCPNILKVHGLNDKASFYFNLYFIKALSSSFLTSKARGHDPYRPPLSAERRHAQRLRSCSQTSILILAVIDTWTKFPLRFDSLSNLVCWASPINAGKDRHFIEADFGRAQDCATMGMFAWGEQIA